MVVFYLLFAFTCLKPLFHFFGKFVSVEHSFGRQSCELMHPVNWFGRQLACPFGIPSVNVINIPSWLVHFHQFLVIRFHFSLCIPKMTGAFIGNFGGSRAYRFVFVCGKRRNPNNINAHIGIFDLTENLVLYFGRPPKNTGGSGGRKQSYKPNFAFVLVKTGAEVVYVF
jgi:hypothetical protein